MHYFEHTKRGAEEGAPKTLRVEYHCGSIMSEVHKEWVCVEHDGFAGSKAAAWWAKRSKAPMPKTAAEAARLATAGALAPVKMIVVEETGGQKFSEIISYDIGDIPEYEHVEDADFFTVEDDPFDDFDDIPF